MVIRIKVKPGSKQTAVDKMPDGSFTVRVKEPAKEGRANDAVIEAISDFLDIPKSRISIRKGAGSRNKVLNVN